MKNAGGILRYYYANKYICLHKVALLLLITLSYLLFKPFILFFFPGFLVFVNLRSTKYSLFESMGYMLVVSLSYWICGFWILKFVPISINQYTYISVIFSLFLLFLKKDIYIPRPRVFDLLSLCMILLLTTPFIFLFRDLIVPDGADMAAHTYTARLIVEKNSFPQSYEPLLPNGVFGSSPIGLPILIALFTIVGGLPIYTASLVVSCFVYVFFCIGLFIFINKYFLNWIAFLTTLTVVWIGKDILSYIGWGGNTTILSLSFVLFAISFFNKIKESKIINWSSIFGLALIIFASFTSHFIPLVVIGYWIAFSFIFSKKFRTHFLKKENLTLIIKVSIIIGILALPYLTDFRLPNQKHLEYVKDWQTNPESDWTWHGNLIDSFYTIPLYIGQRLSLVILVFAFVGITISVRKKIEHTGFYWMALLTSIVIIINSHFWFLPFSPILYPDRTATVSLIPISFFVAIFYKSIFSRFMIEAKIKHYKPKYGTNMLLLLCFLTALFINTAIKNYDFFYYLIKYFNSVTLDDMKTMEWLSENTEKSDVILNNYGDAGIWIPGLAYRRVITNHTNLLDIELADQAAQFKPRYAFIGSKPVYSADIITTKDLDSDPKFQLVYSQGESKVYRILANEELE